MDKLYELMVFYFAYSLFCCSSAFGFEMCLFRDRLGLCPEEQAGFDECWQKDVVGGREGFLAIDETDAFRGRGLFFVSESQEVYLNGSKPRFPFFYALPNKSLIEDGIYLSSMTGDELRYKYPKLNVSDPNGSRLYGFLEFPLQLPDTFLFHDQYGITINSNRDPLRYWFFAPCDTSAPTFWWNPLWTQINTTVDSTKQEIDVRIEQLGTTLDTRINEAEAKLNQTNESMRRSLDEHMHEIESRVDDAVRRVEETDALTKELGKKLNEADALASDLRIDIDEVRRDLVTINALVDTLRAEVALAQSTHSRVDELAELFDHMRVEIYLALIIGVLAFVMEVSGKLVKLYRHIRKSVRANNEHLANNRRAILRHSDDNDEQSSLLSDVLHDQ